MLISEKTIMQSFAEMEEKVCRQNCYNALFITNYRGRYCRNCKMQEFKQALKKFLERVEDDGK